MNERTSGVSRPMNTAHTPYLSNQRSARSIRPEPEMHEVAVPLQGLAADVIPDGPADDRAQGASPGCRPPKSTT